MSHVVHANLCGAGLVLLESTLLGGSHTCPTTFFPEKSICLSTISDLTNLVEYPIRANT